MRHSKSNKRKPRKSNAKWEELENRPWYEKAWDTINTFTWEFTGYYDSIRASTGVEPVTGRKLSEAERIAAGAMAAAGFIPVVAWAGPGHQRRQRHLQNGQRTQRGESCTRCL
ncbi:pre-toxin TG domain-containing protein [Peribacillus butanolivorans]|uniref:pre-toxin TG domain-containing protein n=1 Tax=Peribacillus butanolivorans TaxID=421767 RepID=UPI0037C83120